MSTKRDPPIPLPPGGARFARRAIAAAEALYRAAVQSVRASFENSADPGARRTAELDRQRELIDVQGEQLRILSARLAAMPPHARPHYPPPYERFAILLLKARMGWSVAETARRFLVSDATIAGWTRRLDEQGEDALVAPRAPVNKHSDRVAMIVKRLHALAPTLGKRKVADVLTRAGMRIAASTVQRLKRRNVKTPPTPSTQAPTKRERNAEPKRVVRAKHAHHLWHVDITTIGTGGMSLPWPPFALFLLWPFCFHVALVVDHFSRALVAFAVFKKQPTGTQICSLLDRARLKAGTAPRHVVTDRGMQFGAEYLAWCKVHGARPRFGAIGNHGSIAVIERFIRSLKYEHLLRLVVPFARPTLVARIESYALWFNEHRPHDALGGTTPRDVLEPQSAPRRTRLEPRPSMPIPPDEKRVQRCDDIELVVRCVDGHRHLPIIELRASA